MSKSIKNLSKLSKIIIGLALLLIIGLAAYIFFSKSDTVNYDLGANSYRNAKELPVESACLEPDSSLDISSEDLSAYEMSAITYLHDVPAGTNVDVNIASVSEDTVTGSDIYPEEYGSYNFVLNNQDGNWVVTEFSRCE